MDKVIIDKRLLGQIKRNLLKHYPLEFIYGLWGKTRNNDVLIHAFRELPVFKNTREHCEYEPECEEVQQGEKLKYLGSIHSHPKDSASPSDTDLESAVLDIDGSLPETIIGICGITKRKNRRFVSFGFFERDGKMLELVIGE